MTKIKIFSAPLNSVFSFDNLEESFSEILRNAEYVDIKYFKTEYDHCILVVYRE